jgi:hypothetical protein
VPCCAKLRSRQGEEQREKTGKADIAAQINAGQMAAEDEPRREHDLHDVVDVFWWSGYRSGLQSEHSFGPTDAVTRRGEQSECRPIRGTDRNLLFPGVDLAFHLAHGSREIEHESEGGLAGRTQYAHYLFGTVRYLHICTGNDQAAFRERIAGHALSNLQELHDSPELLS